MLHTISELLAKIRAELRLLDAPAAILEVANTSCSP